MKHDDDFSGNESFQEKADKLGVPLIPKLPKSLPQADPNPVVGVCGECGIELRKVMMLSCGNPNCPVRQK